MRIAGRIARLGGWAVDLASGRIEWSDEVCAIHDLPPGTSPGLDEGINFYAPEFRATIREAFRACAQAGLPYDLELQIITARNRRVWVRAVGEPVRDAGGRIVRVEGAFQDISRRKAAEEALRQSEERFRLLSKATNDAIWDWNLATNQLWWSEGFEVLSGLGAEDVPSIAAWSERIHPDDRERVVRGLDRELARGTTSWSDEYRFRRRDGSYAIVLDRGYVVRGSDGAPIRMIGGMCDITERRRAEEAATASSRRITEVLESITDAFMVLDHDWRFVYLNQRAADLLQRRRHDLLGRKISQEFPEAAHQSFCRQYRRALREQVAVRFEEYYEPLGAWFQVSAYPSQNGISVCFSDITEQKRAEDALQRQAVRQGQLASLGRLAVSSTDIQRLLDEAALAAAQGLGMPFCAVQQSEAQGGARVVRAGVGWSAACLGRRLAAIDRGTTGGAPPESVQVEDFGAQTGAGYPDLLAEHDVRSMLEVVIGDPAQPSGWLAVYDRAPRRFTGEDREFLQSVASMLHVALERCSAEQRAAHLAHFDPLTGLANRRLFQERLERMLRQARRGAKRLALIVVNLDRFGAINDAIGSERGDELLRLVARRLQECLRAGDIAARLAGDEFGIALADLAGVEKVGPIARQVHDAFKRPFSLGTQDVYLSGSLGITIYPDDGADVETLLKNANTALGRAKVERRSTFEYYVPAMNERAADLLRLETELRSALERGQLDAQFSLHYQPKVSVRAQRWSGLEALLRWNHPNQGAVAPSTFIPLLEQTGLIVEVGAWVLRRAARDYRAWVQAGLQPPPVAVNVSLLQLRHVDFVDSVRRILADTALSPAALQLEITESVIMENVDEIASKLRQLKDMGIALSVDDFGTGYSSLAYLSTLPLDELKIDRAFIANMQASAENTTIVSTIISLAHSLGLQVVAEGVETRSQARRLRELGCDELQGFLVGKPIPGEKIRPLLETGRRRTKRAGWREVDQNPAEATRGRVVRAEKKRRDSRGRGDCR